MFEEVSKRRESLLSSQVCLNCGGYYLFTQANRLLSEVTLLIFHPLADTVTVGLGGGAGSSCTSLFIILQEIEGCNLSEAKGEDWPWFERGEGQMGAGQDIDGRKLMHKARGRRAAVAAET